MNQVRFNIGVPRVGSAARIAEDAASENVTPRMPLPRAGSSALDAEQRKRAEGGTRMTATVLALRGTGGIAEPSVAGPASSTGVTDRVPSPGPAQSSPAARNGPAAGERIPAAAPAIHLPPTQLSPLPSGPLQSAAGRVQSLVRTLFFKGGSATRS